MYCSRPNVHEILQLGDLKPNLPGHAESLEKVFENLEAKQVHRIDEIFLYLLNNRFFRTNKEIRT